MSSPTSSDRVVAVAIKEARRRAARGYLREITAATVAELAEREGIDVSRRTIERRLAALGETGVLEIVSENPREYRIPVSRSPATDMTLDGAGDSERREPTRNKGVRTDELADGIGRDPDDLLIYHLYADTGVESEPLSAYGDVLRVGIDPSSSAFGSVIRADARDPPLEARADVAFLHPPCQRWSTLTTSNPDADPLDHPNLIPEARRVGRELAEHYVIENVPQAPLEDPVILEGTMFGLPVRYRRAFETSFPVKEPERNADLRDYAGPFSDADGGLGSFTGEARLWRSVKQVSGDYPAEELKRTGIPAPYIHYLMRWFLRTRR